MIVKRTKSFNKIRHPKFFVGTDKRKNWSFETPDKKINVLFLL